MIRIMFVCHGNICRSPMAEFILKDMTQKKGLGDSFYIASSATSTEELGSPVHYGTKNKLRQHGIFTEGKHAVQLKKRDYDKYNYLIGMDQWNIDNIKRIIGPDPEKKVWKLLDFTENRGDISDPWYTGDFDKTYDDIYRGCQALLDLVLEQDKSKLF